MRFPVHGSLLLLSVTSILIRLVLSRRLANRDSMSVMKLYNLSELNKRQAPSWELILFPYFLSVLFQFEKWNVLRSKLGNFDWRFWFSWFSRDSKHNFSEIIVLIVILTRCILGDVKTYLELNFHCNDIILWQYKWTIR